MLNKNGLEARRNILLTQMNVADLMNISDDDLLSMMSTNTNNNNQSTANMSDENQQKEIFRDAMQSQMRFKCFVAKLKRYRHQVKRTTRCRLLIFGTPNSIHIQHYIKLLNIS